MHYVAIFCISLGCGLLYDGSILIQWAIACGIASLLSAWWETNYGE
jgi:hypothetical protein